MTPEELQAAYDKLVADNADLQLRFDATAQMILGLVEQVKLTEAARDAYKSQAVVYSRQIEEQKAYIKKKGIVTDGPAGGA